MDWLNEGVGLIVLIASVIIILLLAVALFLIFNLRSKIAVQRLKFLGFFSADAITREHFAEITVGNRSLNEVAVLELGIRNGKVSYDLTDLYKEKNGIGKDVRVVIEQRSALRFVLTEEELRMLLVDEKRGKRLGTLRMYVVDLTGTLYQGRIPAVRKLLVTGGKVAAGRIPEPAEEQPAPPEELPAPEKAPEGDGGTAE